MKSVISYISKREFLEKKIKITVPLEYDANDPSKIKRARYIIFFTSIPNDVQTQEPNIVRAQTILGIHAFERMPDKRIKF